MCRPRVALGLRLAYASVGILVGLSVGAVFRVSFHNPPAAYWGLASAFFATLCLVLFVYLYIAVEAKKQLPSRGVLLLAGALSAVGVAAGVGAFSTYLGLGIINTLHGDDRPLFQTEYIVCVWAFMTGKWGVTGYYYSVRSRNTRHTSGYYTAL